MNNDSEFVSHHSHHRHDIHAFPDKLYVVACLENPLRWRSRYINYWHFQRHVENAGGILITVESAFGNRHFQITDPSNPLHVQVRCKDELFRKENLQNIGASRLPLGTKYVAFIDADVLFTRPDWCQETLHLLQHYDVIQMFSSFSDIASDHRIMRMSPSFMYNFVNEQDGSFSKGDYYYGGTCTRPSKWSGAPGLAWAYRVSALDDLGGLLDRCILGGGDSHMAFGVVGKDDLAKLHLEYMHGSNQYRAYIAAWQANAARLKKNVGYMDGSVLHKWHGPKANRQYGTRWQILEKHQYDPFIDVQPDHQGVLRLKGNKIGLRDDMRRHFRERDEDLPQ